MNLSNQGNLLPIYLCLHLERTMKMNLDELEVRVLASLMEKELTTPESYPLTINSLTSACNQKSNRNPVMNLNDAEIVKTMEKLGFRGLARLTATGGRVPRYRHTIDENIGLQPAARGVLSELMLRGAQTAGELRIRGERMNILPDIETIETVLMELLRFGPPLVVQLPRQPGQKEPRYAHLFSGMPDLENLEQGDNQPLRRTTASVANERLTCLTNEINTLRNEIQELTSQVAAFKSQFD